MKKILAGCMAVMMLCGSAMAEAPGSLRERIENGGVVAEETVAEETVAEETMQPEAVETESTTAAQPTGVRKPGELMGDIESGEGATFSQGESASIGVIGGADGPTVVFVATPEAEEATTGEIFVLRDSITWASTMDEVQAQFEDSYTFTDDDIGGLNMEYVSAGNVMISSFEGEICLYFHEGQLWFIRYDLDLEESDANRLIAAFDKKYGPNTAGSEVFEAIFAPMFDDFYDDYEDYVFGDHYNWIACENTTIILRNDEGYCNIYYVNGNYLPDLYEAVESNEASAFGI